MKDRIVKTYEQFKDDEFKDNDPYNEERWTEEENLIDLIHDKLKMSLNAWMPMIVSMSCDGDYIYIRYIETRKYYHIWPEYNKDGTVKGIEVTEFEIGKRENITEFDKDKIDECINYITSTIVEETKKTIR